MRPGRNPRQQREMLIRESQLQMPFLTHTIDVCQFQPSLCWCLEGFVPAMGGKRMARRQRKRSGPSHMVGVLWVIYLVEEEEEEENQGGIGVFVGRGC